MTRCTHVNSFMVICWLGTGLFLLLFTFLVMAPDSFMEGACVAGGEMVYFICRRVAVFMFSFALLLFLFRNAPLSRARVHLFLTLAVCMAGFACTGIHEFAKGGIGASIFASVSIEILFALMFSAQALVDSRRLKNGDSQ